MSSLIARRSATVATSVSSMTVPSWETRRVLIEPHLQLDLLARGEKTGGHDVGPKKRLDHARVDRPRIAGTVDAGDLEAAVERGGRCNSIERGVELLFVHRDAEVRHTLRVA